MRLYSFFQSVLNKSSCLNYLLPDERSDRVIGKLHHPSIFKLPHVHTTRSKTSFINYALDQYIWFYLAFISKLLYFVLCVCLFYFNPAFGLQLSLIKLSWVDYTLSLYYVHVTNVRAKNKENNSNISTQRGNTWGKQTVNQKNTILTDRGILIQNLSL